MDWGGLLHMQGIFRPDLNRLQDSAKERRLLNVPHWNGNVESDELRFIPPLSGQQKVHIGYVYEAHPDAHIYTIQVEFT